MRPQMFKPALGLREVGQMTRRHPPHDEVRPIQRLEPFRPATVDTLVYRLPDETFQGFDRFPHRHVQEQARIVESVDGGGVAAVVLEPPDEAWRVLGNRIDTVEIVDEVGHARVVERIADASDIELGEMKHWSRHRSVLY